MTGFALPPAQSIDRSRVDLVRFWSLSAGQEHCGEDSEVPAPGLSALNGSARVTDGRSQAMPEGALGPKRAPPSTGFEAKTGDEHSFGPRARRPSLGPHNPESATAAALSEIESAICHAATLALRKKSAGISRRSFHVIAIGRSPVCET